VVKVDRVVKIERPPIAEREVGRVGLAVHDIEGGAGGARTGLKTGTWRANPSVIGAAVLG